MPLPLWKVRLNNMHELNNEDFERLYLYIQNNFGIDLHKKKQLVTSRLSSTIISEGYNSFHEYVDAVLSGKRPELIEPMLNRLTTNYTYFMREEQHFSFLNDTILPELARRHERDRVLSIWSAGCSSGEEPYNISMYLLEYFRKLGGRWDTRILATDISQRVLMAAMDPSYPPESLEKLPPEWSRRYFIKKDNGDYTVSRELKENVIFRPFNLMEPIRFKLSFDLIFCRNVMIYFDQPTKDALVSRFYNAGNPGGYLIIGHSESINKAASNYRCIKPSIYQKPIV